MKNLKIIFLTIIVSIVFSHCSTIKDGFKSQRKNSTDEFMVEKKQPLVMPPNYNDLPIPDENIDDKTDKNFKNLVITNEEIKSKTDQIDKQNKSTENFILGKIKNN